MGTEYRVGYMRYQTCKCSSWCQGNSSEDARLWISEGTSGTPNGVMDHHHPDRCYTSYPDGRENDIVLEYTWCHHPVSA